jgi:hypothetical protein
MILFDNGSPLSIKIVVSEGLKYSRIGVFVVTAAFSALCAIEENTIVNKITDVKILFFILL